MNQALPDDKDRDLAARLQAPGAWPAEGEDPVVDAVRALQSDYRALQIDPRAPSRIWAGIERKTRLGSDRTGVRRVSTMRLVWGSLSVAAAVALLLVVPRVFSPAQAQLLAQADAVQTAVTLEDGSRVELRPNSRLFGALDGSAFRIEGEAFFDVAHDPERTFSVETEQGLIEVLGTRFNVAASDDETSVFLEEGRVKLSSPTGESVVLSPSQVAAVANGRIQSPESNTGEEAMDWLRGLLVFESRTAGQVASELSRHYAIGIQIPDGLRQVQITGALQLDSQQQALDDFALVLGGRFVAAGDGLRFIGN